jgi:membrane dipeptidase
VLDLHADLAWSVHGHRRRLGDRSFELSEERLRRGGVRALVVPLFVDDAAVQPPAAVRAAYEATWDALRAELPGPPIAVRLSFEGADGFADDPDAALPWIARGACLFGLVHARTSALGGASQDPIRARRRVGLTARGAALARRVLRAGALLDVAHASDATFDDLARIAAEAGAPLVDSHTGMRALVAVDRNLDDERLRAVAASGGVVGVSLHGGHVGHAPGEPPTLDDVVTHLEHAVRVAGAEHVGLGSDLGGDITAPVDGDGAATFPLLEARLRARGWSREQVRAVFWDNAARVLRWSTAHGCGAPVPSP